MSPHSSGKHLNVCAEPMQQENPLNFNLFTYPIADYEVNLSFNSSVLSLLVDE